MLNVNFVCVLDVFQEPGLDRQRDSSGQRDRRPRRFALAEDRNERNLGQKVSEVDLIISSRIGPYKLNWIDHFKKAKKLLNIDLKRFNSLHCF